MAKYNIGATIAYNLQGDNHSVFTSAKLTINPLELTPKTTSPFDMENHQVFTQGPVPRMENYASFCINRMSYPDQLFYYEKYLEYCKACGITNPRHDKWTYSSMACHSKDKFRIDIYKPGRCMMKCTIPELGCASGWFFYAENYGDFGKPQIMPIDQSPVPREVYFEIDIFETFREFLGTRVSCTGHWGTPSNRKHTTTGILSRFSGFHYPEVIWDGLGNWIWKLDGVTILKAFIPNPLSTIYPYLKLTYMVMEEFPENRSFSEWIVPYVKLSDAIMIPKSNEDKPVKPIKTVA